MSTFPELEVSTRRFKVELDQFYAFTDRADRKFDRLTITDKQKLALTLPIPAIELHISGSSPTNSEETDSDASGFSTKQADSNSPRRTGTFKIDGKKFVFKYSSYEHENEFTTPLTNKKKLTEAQFVSKHVMPYINLGINYKNLYSINKSTRLLLSFQESTEQTRIEREVESALNQCLYNPIRMPLLYTLERIRENVTDDLGTFFTEKSVTSDPGIPFPLQSDFIDIDSVDLKFLGNSLRPDACVGFIYKNRPETVAYATSLIEIKTPTFKLKESYSELCHTNHDSKASFDRYGMIAEGGQLLELQEVIRRYVTACVHTGCDKFIVSDYNSFLSIQIEKSSSLLASDVESEDKVGDKRDHSQKSKDREVVPPTLISCSHFLINRTHANARLYILGFLSMNREEHFETKEFQQNVVKMMTEKYSKEKIDTPPNSNEAVRPLKQQKTEHHQAEGIQKRTGIQETDGNLSGVSPPITSGDGSYVFEKDLFEPEYKLDLGPIMKRLIRVASYARTQVISVDTKEFIKCTSSRFFHNEIPQLSVLKIFDPLWGEYLKDELGDDVQYKYADAVSFCVRDLKVFEKIKLLMGDVVPWVFSYGRLTDHHVSCGQTYTRFWGPFIQMEYLERDETFTEDQVTWNFVYELIIPAFKALHKCGVLYYNYVSFKFEDIIITKDHKVKIVNFNNAIFTEKKKLFDNDIRGIIDYFETLLK